MTKSLPIMVESMKKTQELQSQLGPTQDPMDMMIKMMVAQNKTTDKLYIETGVL